MLYSVRGVRNVHIIGKRHVYVVGVVSIESGSKSLDRRRLIPAPPSSMSISHHPDLKVI